MNKSWNFLSKILTLKQDRSFPQTMLAAASFPLPRAASNPRHQAQRQRLKPPPFPSRIPVRTTDIALPLVPRSARRAFDKWRHFVAEKRRQRQLLLREAFRQWTDFVWERRYEWKMDVRAKVKYRLGLQQRLMRKWRCDLMTRRVSAERFAIARRIGAWIAVDTDAQRTERLRDRHCRGGRRPWRRFDNVATFSTQN
jgi:hypothetical protein